MCLVLHFEKPPGTMSVYMHGKTCDTHPMRSYCFVHEEKDFYYENSWHSKRRAHFRYDMDDICITHCLSLLVFQMMNLMSHTAERKNLCIFFTQPRNTTRLFEGTPACERCLCIVPPPPSDCWRWLLFGLFCLSSAPFSLLFTCCSVLGVLLCRCWKRRTQAKEGQQRSK